VNQRPYRDFYRILEGPVPTLRDFTSFQALGRPLRRQTPELLRRWSGISVYETEDQAPGSRALAAVDRAVHRHDQDRARRSDPRRADGRSRDRPP
jgi:hypothetical protein